MNALPSPDVARWLPAQFDLPRIAGVRLLRAYTNDVYLVETREARFVLKVYGAGWRHDREIRFEVNLLDHLAAKGISVAQAIVGIDGDALRHIAFNGETRLAVLFHYAAGSKPEPPFSPAMYYQEGRAVAALHHAADDFRTLHQRRPLDLATLVDGPLALVDSLGIDATVVRSIEDFGLLVRTRIEHLTRDGLDWGVCHGDLTFDNLHLTDDDEFVWYDFDSSGYGWRAIDLQGWTVLADEWRPLSDAFLTGYREVRPLGENDIAAAPYLAIAQEIWGIQIDLERRLLAKGPLAVQAYLTKRVDRLMAWQQRFHKNE